MNAKTIHELLCDLVAKYEASQERRQSSLKEFRNEDGWAPPARFAEYYLVRSENAYEAEEELGTLLAELGKQASPEIEAGGKVITEAGTTAAYGGVRPKG